MAKTNFMFFFKRLIHNVGRCFQGTNLLWHLSAIVLTALLVLGGFDWYYYLHTRAPLLRSILFPAVPLGSMVPIYLPILILAFGVLRKNVISIRAGWVLIQAEVIALFLSFFYKAFTGRIPPRDVVDGVDLSHGFRFGFLRGGVFWGWPSSHASVAFATAFALIYLFPRSRTILYLMLAYALYVGIGVSATIHWFSEAVAGGIFGAMVGRVVAKDFRPKVAESRQ